MNRKYLGSSFDDHGKELEEKYPTLRAAVNKLKAKAIMRHLLKEARKAKWLSQADLAKEAAA